MNDSHVALIVEDDPLIASILKEQVASLGHRFQHASHLEEARRAIEAGGYCYVLLDMQFPVDGDPQSHPTVGCGETALRLIRKRDARVNERGKHLVPVIIVTSYSRDPEFVSKMLSEADADDFVAKPFGRLDLFLDKIRRLLERVGREEHDACDEPRAPVATPSTTPPRAPRPSSAPPPARTPGAPVTPSVTLEIDGTRGSRKSNVIVAGESRALQDSLFASLVPAIGAHLASPSGWTAGQKLGLTNKAHAPYRIRKAFEDLLPEGFEILEASKTGEFRLNPGIAIGEVAWEALVEHPEVEVQKVARERVGRRR